MNLLLDTDAFAAVVRNAPSAANRFLGSSETLYLSTVSITELESWLLKFRTPLRYRQSFFALLRSVTLLDVTEPIAHRAAMLNGSLRSQRRRLGLADLLIAATAVEQQLALILYRGQQFLNIPGLTVMDWSIP